MWTTQTSPQEHRSRRDLHRGCTLVFHPLLVPGAAGGPGPLRALGARLSKPPSGDRAAQQAGAVQCAAVGLQLSLFRPEPPVGDGSNTHTSRQCPDEGWDTQGQVAKAGGEGTADDLRGALETKATE